MDDEPLFLLMMLVHDEGPHGVSIWKAVLVEGHGYALVASADKGWMWGIANDIEFQLKAI